MTPEDPPSRLVFVYGTLRTGDSGYTELALHDRTVPIGQDRISGTLYDLGEYPALLLGGNGTVTGELLVLKDDTVLDDLDAFECYDPADPHGSEYVRRCVLTLDRRLKVWVYVYNRLPGRHPVIASGDWARS